LFRNEKKERWRKQTKRKRRERQAVEFSVWVEAE
jgi:hypothetical protein